jgi:hypothetical protein
LNVKHVLGAAAGLALTVGMAVIPAQSASALTGVGYDYTDPASTGCSNDARTIDARNLVWPDDGSKAPDVIELRYSPSCRTAWARLSHAVPWHMTNGQWSGGSATIMVYRGSSAPSIMIRCDAGANGSCYTKQVYDGGYVAQACGNEQLGGGSKLTARACTRWY